MPKFDDDILSELSKTPETGSKKFSPEIMGELEVKEQSDTPSKAPGVADRFVVKNLVAKSPTLQLEYLKKKGIDARMQNGELVYREGKEWKNVDLAGWDPQDLLDIVGDTVSGVMTAAGAMAAGTIGGGLGSAAAESLQQSAARLVGARPEYDLSEIGKEAGIGAGLGLAGRVGVGLSKLAGSNIVTNTLSDLLMGPGIGKQVVKAGLRAVSKVGEKTIPPLVGGVKGLSESIQSGLESRK